MSATVMLMPPRRSGLTSMVSRTVNSLGLRCERLSVTRALTQRSTLPGRDVNMFFRNRCITLCRDCGMEDERRAGRPSRVRGGLSLIGRPSRLRMNARMSWGVAPIRREVRKPRSRASTVCDAAQIKTSASQIVAMPCSCASTGVVASPMRKSIGRRMASRRARRGDGIKS